MGQSMTLIACDIETTGLDWKKCGVIGIGLYSCTDKLITFTKDINHINKDNYEFIYHNGIYDIKVAKRKGIDLPYHHDTLLMASLLQYIDQLANNILDEHKIQESLKLSTLATKELGIENWKIDWDKDRPSYDDIKRHCLMDCKVTYKLFEIYNDRLIKNNLWNSYNN